MLLFSFLISSKFYFYFFKHIAFSLREISMCCIVKFLPWEGRAWQECCCWGSKHIKILVISKTTWHYWSILCCLCFSYCSSYLHWLFSCASKNKHWSLNHSSRFNYNCWLFIWIACIFILVFSFPYYYCICSFKFYFFYHYHSWCFIAWVFSYYWFSCRCIHTLCVSVKQPYLCVNRLVHN